MNNKNPDPKNLVNRLQSIQANRIVIKKKIKNEMAHDINNDKIRVIAIYQLILQLIHSIELTLFAADAKAPMQIAVQMPHNAFMWTMEAWQERRNYGVYWMNVVAKAKNRAWLEERKMQVDLRQLNDLALSILLSYIEKEPNQETFTVVRSVQEYRNLDETLPKELLANTNQWNLFIAEKDDFDKCTNTINVLEQHLMQPHMKDLLTQKAKERYIRRHNEVSEQEAKLAAETQMNALIKQIDEYKERSENDAFIAIYKRDVYHNTIELLRVKTENIEKQFVTKEVETENRRQFLVSGIAKMKSNYAYLQAKLRLYRTAVQQFNEGIITDFTELRSDMRSLKLSQKSIVNADKSRNTNLSNIIERSNAQIKAI